MANPIYAEVVPRELSYATQARLVQAVAWYVRPDGDLDVEKLMGAFQTFLRDHSEHWLERFDYREAGPQLLLQAFLQRIVNGGRIEREYGLGYGRTDLLIMRPLGAGAVTRTVIECKVLHRRHGLSTTIAHRCLRIQRDRMGFPSASVNFPTAIVMKSINVQMPTPPSVRSITRPVPVLPT